MISYWQLPNVSLSNVQHNSCPGCISNELVKPAPGITQLPGIKFTDLPCKPCLGQALKMQLHEVCHVHLITPTLNDLPNLAIDLGLYRK